MIHLEYLINNNKQSITCYVEITYRKIYHIRQTGRVECRRWLGKGMNHINCYEAAQPGAFPLFPRATPSQLAHPPITHPQFGIQTDFQLAYPAHAIHQQQGLALGQQWMFRQGRVGRLGFQMGG